MLANVATPSTECATVSPRSFAPPGLAARDSVIKVSRNGGAAAEARTVGGGGRGEGGAGGGGGGAEGGGEGAAGGGGVERGRLPPGKKLEDGTADDDEGH